MVDEEYGRYKIGLYVYKGSRWHALYTTNTVQRNTGKQPLRKCWCMSVYHLVLAENRQYI